GTSSASRSGTARRRSPSSSSPAPSSAASTPPDPATHLGSLAPQASPAAYPELPERHTMSRLIDKIAIVTGAARGLGRGIAERLASEGATVVVTDVNEEGAKQAAEEIGGGAIGLGCDVSDYASVEAMVADVKERFGRADVLVHQ